MAKPPTSASKPPRSPDVRFRPQIAAALAEGASSDDMILRLTLNDASRLSRDRDIPVADISFTGGVMRYLGIRVEKGGVPESVLDRTAPAAVE
jgi:hypothetical protein